MPGKDADEFWMRMRMRMLRQAFFFRIKKKIARQAGMQMNSGCGCGCGCGCGSGCGCLGRVRTINMFFLALLLQWVRVLAFLKLRLETRVPFYGERLLLCSDGYYISILYLLPYCLLIEATRN